MPSGELRVPNAGYFTTAVHVSSALHNGFRLLLSLGGGAARTGACLDPLPDQLLTYQPHTAALDLRRATMQSLCYRQPLGSTGDLPSSITSLGVRCCDELRRANFGGNTLAAPDSVCAVTAMCRFQVEYALEAVRRGTLAVGVRGTDSVVLGEPCDVTQRPAIPRMQAHTHAKARMHTRTCNAATTRLKVPR